mgnify:CR=1 FL=1
MPGDVADQGPRVAVEIGGAFAVTVILVGIAKLIGELGGEPLWVKGWGVLSIVAGLRFVACWESDMDHETNAGAPGSPPGHSMPNH